METMKLSNGVEIPVLGYGVYQVTPAECERCGERCHQRGVPPYRYSTSILQ
jgi:diketogulonate reductase-like aldo/keto reductase